MSELKRYYEYKGYAYKPYEDVEPEENIKIFHYVEKDGKEVASLDWTPYAFLTLDQFRLFVDAGFPDRFKVREFGGPLSEDELYQIRQNKIDEEVRQNLIKGAQ